MVTNGQKAQNMSQKNGDWPGCSVFQIDVMHYEICGGDMKVVCAVIKPESVARYLGHG